MYKLTSKLVIYKNIKDNSILFDLANIIKVFDSNDYSKEELITEIYVQINKILEIATTYGFDKNLWHNYLAYVLAVNENPFSITCEGSGANEGTVNIFAKSDFKIFLDLFNYDFSKIQEELGIDCFDIILNYTAISKSTSMYNKNVSDKVKALSESISEAKNENEVFDIVTDFYKNYGVGKFGLNKAFRIIDSSDNNALICPITNIEEIHMDDLVGYESQKKKLIDNTQAFVDGKKANNVLLYGDSGTGKSTSIKALLNEFYPKGLRIIEIYKHQFKNLSNVISQIKSRNYKFIIYMDDLSFEEFEIEYKYLKAVIEGGLEIKPDNVLIYATSNRRHLIRETWSDRSDISDDELHRSDTMQEKLSLVNRFGISISFMRPDKKFFNEIVINLARRHPQINLSDEELIMEANKWELANGGMSGRCAKQFITYLLSKM